MKQPKAKSAMAPKGGAYPNIVGGLSTPLDRSNIIVLNDGSGRGAPPKPPKGRSR